MQTELYQFHEKHFSEAAITAFEKQFFHPDPVEASEKYCRTHPLGKNSDHSKYEEEIYDEENDGLGFYPDGVKRTLTDEQIAIFRHSEMEAIRRAERKKQGQGPQSSLSAQKISANLSASDQVRGTTRHKRNRNKHKHQRKQEPKPDLRKRTWDVVEPGLDTLEYD